MDRIRDEMAGAKSPAMRQLGELVTMLAQERPEWEPRFEADGKTLKGAYDAMEKRARANKKGMSYCMGPDETAAVLCEYYGIEVPSDECLSIWMRAMSGNGGTGKKEQGTGNEERGTGTTEARTDSGEHAQTPAPAAFDLDAMLGGL